MNTTVDFDADGPAGRALAAYLNRLDERGIEFRQRIRQEVLAEFADAQDALLGYFADEDRIESSRETILDRHPAADERNVIRYVGDYALLEHIGTGGMGTVYRARQSTTGRIVAVKLVRNSSPEMLERFRREAQAIANLRHPNIVTLFEAGEHEGEFYYSMDYVENGSLSRAIRDARPSPKQAAEWTQMIAGALDYAHSKGVLHRDIKPQNILLDENRNPLIADFGLAKLMQDGKAWEQSRAIVGTFAYMPPEQAQASDAQLGPASDVYSLGATLYEMLTGQPPIEGDNEAEVIQRLVAREPKPIRPVNRAVPRDLETICLKCLLKEPERRYATARLLASDLERFLRSEPVQARPITAPERFARWCRREPFIAGSLLLVAISLLTTAIGFGVAFYREQQFSERLKVAARKIDAELARSLADQAAIALAADQPLRSSHLLGRALTVLEADPVDEAVVGELTASTKELERQIRQRLSAQINAFYPIEQVIPLTEPGYNDSMPLLSPLKEAPIKSAIRDSFIYVHFSPDKKYGLVVADSTTHGNALLYDFAEGRRIASVRLAESSAYFPITFSPSNDIFTLHGLGNSIRRWSLATGEELPSLTHPVVGEDSTVSDLEFLSNGSKIVSTTIRRNTVFLWDARSGKLLDQVAISTRSAANDSDGDCSVPLDENTVKNTPNGIDPPSILPPDSPIGEKRLEFVDDAEFQVSGDGQHAVLVLQERCHVFTASADGKLEVFVPDAATLAYMLSTDGSVLVIFGKDTVTTFDLQQKKQLVAPVELSTINVNFYLDTKSKTLLALQRNGTRSVIDIFSGKVSSLPPLFNSEHLVDPQLEDLGDFTPAGTSASNQQRIGELCSLEEASVRVDFNESSPFGRSTALFGGEQLLTPQPSTFLIPTGHEYDDVPLVSFLSVPKSLLMAKSDYSGSIHKLFHGQQRRLGPRLTFLEGDNLLEFHESSNRLISVEAIAATVWNIPDHLRIQDELKSIPIDRDQLVIDPQTLLPIGIIEGPTMHRDSQVSQLLTSTLDSDRMGELFDSSRRKQGNAHYLADSTGSTIWQIGIQDENDIVVRAYSFNRHDGLRLQREFPITSRIRSASVLTNGRFLLELGSVGELVSLAVLDIEREHVRFLEIGDNGVIHMVNPDAPESEPYGYYTTLPAYCLTSNDSTLYFRDKAHQANVLQLEGGQLSRLPLTLTADQAVMFDPAERHVVVQDASWKLSVYDLKNLSQPVQSIQNKIQGRTYSFRPSGREMFLAGDQGHVSFVNLDTGSMRSANWKYGWMAPRGYRWLNDVRMLTDDGVNRLRDTKSLQPLGQPMREHVCLSPDAQVMVNKDSENRHFLWDVNSGQMLGPPLPVDVESGLFNGDVNFHFSADSNWLYILDKGFLRKNPVPKPITGSARELQLRIELLTATAMDESLTLRGLDGHEWQIRSQRLRKGIDAFVDQ